MHDGTEENTMQKQHTCGVWFLPLPREECSCFGAQREHSFFECSCRSNQLGWHPSGTPSGLVLQTAFTPAASSGLLGQKQELDMAPWHQQSYK